MIHCNNCKIIIFLIYLNTDKKYLNSNKFDQSKSDTTELSSYLYLFTLSYNNIFNNSSLTLDSYLYKTKINYYLTFMYLISHY